MVSNITTTASEMDTFCFTPWPSQGHFCWPSCQLLTELLHDTEKRSVIVHTLGQNAAFCPIFQLEIKNQLFVYFSTLKLAVCLLFGLN